MDLAHAGHYKKGMGLYVVFCLHFNLNKTKKIYNRESKTKIIKIKIRVLKDLFSIAGKSV